MKELKDIFRITSSTLVLARLLKHVESCKGNCTCCPALDLDVPLLAEVLSHKDWTMPFHSRPWAGVGR